MHQCISAIGRILLVYTVYGKGFFVDGPNGKVKFDVQHCRLRVKLENSSSSLEEFRLTALVDLLLFIP
jgi:hypothetical protein